MHESALFTNHHRIQRIHLGREIHHPERSTTTPVHIFTVDRTVPVEKLLVLIGNHGPQALEAAIVRGRFYRFPGSLLQLGVSHFRDPQAPEQQSGHDKVTIGIEMYAIECQGAI